MAASSPRFAVSTTSMSFSSVDDMGHQGHPPRRHPGHRSDVGGGNSHNSLSPPAPTLLRPSQQQQQQQPTSELIDAVSRSLNTRDDPELERLPRMRHHDEEDEDDLRSEVDGTAGLKTLYSKGFLISARVATDKDPPEPCGVAFISTASPGSNDPQKQQQQQQQQQQKRQSYDRGDASISHLSQSRGGTASSSISMPHRLLTVEEINELRRVSAAAEAASQSASQLQSSSTFCAGESGKAAAVAARKTSPHQGSHQVSLDKGNNVSTGSAMSSNGRPLHRQLTSEEAARLFAQRQLETAAGAATTTTTAGPKDTAAPQPVSPPQPPSQKQPQKQQQQAQRMSIAEGRRSKASSLQHSGSLQRASSDSMKPWLSSEEITRSGYCPPAGVPTGAAGATDTCASATTGSSSGAPRNSSAFSSAIINPVAADWTRENASPGGGRGGGSGVAGSLGFSGEPPSQAWAGRAIPWRDAHVGDLAERHSGGGVSGFNGTAFASRPPDAHGAVTVPVGPAGVSSSTGGRGECHAPLSPAAGSRPLSSGSSITGFMWLPNTSCWTPQEPSTPQQQQQQHSHQPQHRPSQQDLLSFVPPQSSLVDSVTTTGVAATAAWGSSSTATGISGASLRSGSLTFVPSVFPSMTLQALTTAQVEGCIRQCEAQLERLRQERDLLLQELQRRYQMAAAATAAITSASQRGHEAAAQSWSHTIAPPSAVASGPPIHVTTAASTTPLMALSLSQPVGAFGDNNNFSDGGSGGDVANRSHLWQLFTGLVGSSKGMAESTVMTAATPSQRTGALYDPPVPSIQSILEHERREDWGLTTATTTAMARPGLSEGNSVAVTTQHTTGAAGVKGSGVGAGGGRASGDGDDGAARGQPREREVRRADSNSGRQRRHTNSTSSGGCRQSQPMQPQNPLDHSGNGNNNSRSTQAPSRERSLGSRSHNNSGKHRRTTGTSAGDPTTSVSHGCGGNRCSHDNTPQEQKYLQTDPFSMYLHNKKVAAAANTLSSGGAASTQPSGEGHG